MSERILDEAFAAELAANRTGSADERFNRVQELLDSATNAENSALISTLLEIIKDQNHRIAELEEQLYRVYVKSGESMAQLKKDVGSSGSSGTATAEILLNLKAELKLMRGDIYASTDQQIQHIEKRMDALEHENKRFIETIENRLSELEEQTKLSTKEKR